MLQLSGVMESPLLALAEEVFDTAIHRLARFESSFNRLTNLVKFVVRGPERANRAFRVLSLIVGRLTGFYTGRGVEGFLIAGF